MKMQAIAFLRAWKNNKVLLYCTAQFSFIAQSCLTLWDPMDCSTPGLPVHHQLLKFTQTHVHWVSDDIQPSHPLSSPSSPTFNLSQQQYLWVLLWEQNTTTPPTRWRMITSSWAQDSLNTALLCHHQMVNKKICTPWKMMKTNAFPQMVNEN